MPKLPKGAYVLAPVAAFVGRVNKYILNPLIILMFAASLAVFLFGVFQFIVKADQAEDRETGQQHMLWGVVGMAIMFAVYAILHLIQNTFGMDPNPIING